MGLLTYRMVGPKTYNGSTACIYRLGQLADQVKTDYGDRTLAKFARAIGKSPSCVKRYRDVYRAFPEIGAPERQLSSYSVRKELATHPKREQIIRDNPNLTRREAQDLMRRHRGTEKEKQKQDQEDEWLRDNRRWFNDLVALADEVSRAVDVVDECTPEQLDNLLRAVDPKMLMYVRGGGRRLAGLADRLEALLEEQEVSAPVEASPPIERAPAEATAQVAVA